MDKFLEKIQIKKKQYDEIKKIIIDSNSKLTELLKCQSDIDKEILQLDIEYDQNTKLISEIIKYPQMKKELINGLISIFLRLGILDVLPFVLISIMVKIPQMSMIASFFLMLNITIISVHAKNVINERKKKVNNFNIGELEQMNDLIIVKKKNLNSQKEHNEVVISNLRKIIEEYTTILINLQEDINFIENIRSEYIAELCTEILDQKFEIEQSNPVFQKVIKPNSQ